MRRRFENILTKTGRLKKAFTPAVYFDTSVLVEYWSAEGPEVDAPSILPPNEYNEFLREFLKADKRVSEVGQIRKAILIDGPSVLPVTSPLATLELIEWHASAVFKQEASEVAGAITVQRKSRKEIGDLLRRLTDFAQEERRQKRKQSHSTPVELLAAGTWLNPSFSEYHGLDGVVEADLVNFHVTLKDVWSKACILSYHQVGMADVLHVLAASHLGCSYFASFDSDFRRVSDILLIAFGLKLVPSSQELIQVLATEKTQQGHGGDA
jgi:predicted nucleic acid-binding protein